MRLKNIMGFAALTLTCLVAAGCEGPETPPEFRPSATNWQSGFNTGLEGLPRPQTDDVSFQTGYDAGIGYRNNPAGPRPKNPYQPPAGNQPPSASGGG